MELKIIGKNNYIIKKTIICILLAFFVVTTLCLNHFSLGRYLNSDMYGDMWVSKLMWEQKTLFPDNWVFGNQLYILSTPNIAALFYGLTGNMMLSMSFASNLMVILTLLAFVYCFKACFQRKTILIGLTAFFAGFVCYRITDNEFGQLFFTGATFYSCYIITLLVSLGVYLRVIKEGSIKKQKALFAVSLILTFIMGVQSLRQTLIAVLPILAFEVIYELVRARRKHWINKSSLCFACLLTVSNLGGVFVSKILPVNREEIFGGLGFSLFQNIGEKLSSTLSNITSLLGLHDIYLKARYGSSITFFDIFPLVGTIALLTMFIVFMILIVKKKMNNKTSVAGICVLLFGVLGTLAAFWVIDIERLAKYLFVFFLLIPAVAMSVYETVSFKNRLKVEVMICLVGVIVLVTAYIAPLVETYTQVTPYDEVAEYMQENGYDTVYAVWEDAGPVAGASDGAIIAGRWDATAVFKIKSHTNVFGIYSEEDNRKACYLFNSKNYKEAEEYLGDDFSLLHLLAQFGNGNDELYLCSSEKQLMYE